MAIIKSGDSTDQLKIDGPSKAARAALYDTTGTAITNANPLPVVVTSGATGSASLPAGAATAQKQTDGNTSLASLDSKLPAQGAATMAAALPVTLASDQAPVQVQVQNLPTEQAVSAADWPLPTGAATAQAQSDGNASLATLAARTPGLGQAMQAGSVPVTMAFNQSPIAVTQASSPLPTGAATEATLSGLNTKVTASANGVRVDGSGSTQPVSGTVAVSNLPAVQAVSAAALPLPTGAATETSLASLNTKVTASANGVRTDGSATTQPISAAALPLPAGAATSALQTSTGTTLTSILANTPAPGQKTAVNSAPVVLASDQPAVPTTSASLPLPAGAATDATLSGLSGKFTTTANGLKVDGSAATQPITAAALPLPAGAATETSLSALLAKFSALGQKAMAASAPVVIASDQTAIPVTIGTQALPTGAATAAAQATGNTSLASIDGKTPALGQTTAAGSVPVVLASNQAAVPTTAASLPLPTGAATETTLSGLSGKFGALGQKAMVASAPVVIASDQSAIPVSVGTQALPTGAATSAAQATGNSSLASIDGKVPAQGQAAMAASLPVVLASNQTAVPTSSASLPLPTGASTAALQTSGNASLTTLASNSPALGQKTAAGSVPVTLASDQAALPVTGNVAVTNLPATQTVSGTVAVSNLPFSQQVTGNVAVSNFPSSQPVSGTVAVAPLSGIKASQAAVTTTAAQLMATPLAGRSTLTLTSLPTNTANVWVGASGVTAATGFPVGPGQSLGLDVGPSATIFAIASAGSQTVACLEVA